MYNKGYWTRLNYFKLVAYELLDDGTSKSVRPLYGVWDIDIQLKIYERFS